MHHVRSPLLGSTLVSLPNAVYGGVAANDPAIGQALIDEAKRLATKLRVKHLELRHDVQASAGSDDPDLKGKELYVAFDCPISTNDESLMKTFPPDLRRMIRIGVKNELTTEFGREALLDEFYDAYAASVHRLGSPVFPKRLFAACLKSYGDECDIMMIRKDGRVAGTVLSFYFRDTVFPYYSGSYPEFNRAGINNFMYWELMRSAARRGFTKFDFGRSKRGTGAYDFKRGWRMTERALPYKYFLVTAKAVPDVNPLNPKLQPFVNLWKRVPPSVAKFLGPIVVRHLP